MNLLLVEDEAITRKGMLKHIPWGSFGVDAVKAAENADSALKLCGEWKPDIILSDIRMRGLDGIEMCRLMLERFPDCQIVFCSGYSQKEYLKAAIELGAVQYLEKPVSPEEVEEAVKKAAERVKARRRQRLLEQDYNFHRAAIERDVLHSLFRAELKEQQVEALKSAGLFRQGGWELRVCLLYCRNGGPDIVSRLERGLNALKDRMGLFYSIPESLRAGRKGTVTVVVSAGFGCLGRETEEMRALLWMAQREGLRENCFLAAGAAVRRPEELRESLRSAEAAKECLSWKNFGSVAWEDERCSNGAFFLTAEEEEAFCEAVGRADEEAAEVVLKGLQERLVSERAAMNGYVKGIYMTLFRILARESGDIGQGLEMDVDEAETLQELYECMREELKIFFQQKREQDSPVIHMVIRKIQESWADRDLSVTKLAEEVYLTPAYLSAVFKKQTGTTVKQYLTNVRMEHAKALLREKKWKLYQIADMVGYEDAAYFTRIFKAQTGLTPSEYREKKL